MSVIQTELVRAAVPSYAVDGVMTRGDIPERMINITVATCGVAGSSVKLLKKQSPRLCVDDNTIFFLFNISCT